LLYLGHIFLLLWKSLVDRFGNSLEGNELNNGIWYLSCPQRSNTSVEAERLRRARSYEAPPLLAAESIYSGGFSVLGGMKRGRSAQAALGTATLAPASAPALAEDRGREWEQDAFDWRNSIGLSDEVSISFDFGDELDSVSGEV